MNREQREVHNLFRSLIRAVVWSLLFFYIPMASLFFFGFIPTAIYAMVVLVLIVSLRKAASRS